MFSYEMKYIQDADENDILDQPILQGKNLYNALAQAAAYAVEMQMRSEDFDPYKIARKIIEQDRDILEHKQGKYNGYYVDYEIYRDEETI